MKKLIKEFEEFALGSDLLQLATAVIMGTAGGKVVSSLVESILMPIIGIFLGGTDFSNLSYTVGSSTIKYGMFIQSVIDFLIITLCVFFIVKGSNSITKKLKKEKESAKTITPTTDDYLKEIRDLLVAKK